MSTEVHAGKATPASTQAFADMVRPFDSVRHADVPTVGGKGANLGEMTAAGLPVPPGFVLTIDAYEAFCNANELGPRITAELKGIAPDDTAALSKVSSSLREVIDGGTMPDGLRAAIEAAYGALVGPGATRPRVAVRSSATAEDTAQFSFAGMFESFLNIAGPDELVDAVKKCWASTFGARVLYYRISQGMPAEMPVAVIVQRMVNSEKSGVMFTTDPATRDASRMVIEAAWGLGESVVQGAVTPDRHVLDKKSLQVLSSTIADKEFLLTWDESSKSNKRVELAGDPRAKAPVLTSQELQTLGALARRAEEHYGKPQDLEFAIENKDVYLTQSRPITTLGPAAPQAAAADGKRPLVHGLGASPGVAAGKVRVLQSPDEEASMEQAEVLVTKMTSPDWVPIMRRAAAIVTDSGGMTSHAAIVARELGTPCVVGAREATRVLVTGTLVTVDGGAGTVVAGAAAAPESSRAALSATQAWPTPPREAGRLVTATRVYVNLGEPDRAAEVAQKDVDGVGLLRAEFMMLAALEHTHPRAFLKQKSGDEFVHRMADGLRTFARAFDPRPVIYRTMDFRSNEFRNLKGGEPYEPQEANPMIGYRGCFRYTREPDLFALELRAVAEVRRDFENLHIMIPFVRTGHELETCLRLIDQSPLRGDAHLERWIMAEVPSVVHWLPKYVAMGITGVSIGSNDLTQLVLGVDRDSDLFGAAYDERDPAVLDAIRSIVAECRRLDVTCSICGQAPSVHPEYAARLVEWGIDSISVNVDAIDRTRRNVAIAEERLLLERARRAPESR